jgi:hypothetical protein
MTASVLGELPAFVDERVEAVFGHWLSCRRGRLVPRRSDLSPGAIAACLPHVWIYRWRPERDSFQNVLAGEEINQAWTFSIQGKFLDELFGPNAPVLQRRWLELLSRPAVAYGRLAGDMGHAHYKRAERLSLPLVDDAGGPYGIFGISIYSFDLQRAGDTAIPPPLDVVIVPCDRLPAAVPRRSAV